MNSSPLKPSRSIQHRNAYFSLSVTVFLAEAFFCVSAWWLTARQNCMYAFISPAWVVLLKSRNSTLFEFLNKVDYSLY